MFDLYGCYFNYAGFDSYKYDLIFASLDTDRINSLQGARTVNTVFSRKNNKHYITSVTFDDEEPFTFEAEIFTASGDPIDKSWLTTIERALFGRQTFGKLRPIGTKGLDEPYINCMFIEPERIESIGGVVGYKFTIVTDSNLMWVPETTETFTFEDTTSGIKTFTVPVDTDLAEYIYPSVKIKMGTSGGNISLYNNTDNAERITGFTGVNPNTTFTIDSTRNYISNNMYPRFTSRYFIRLLNGDNAFAFTGNIVSITMTYNNRKFI